jgi:hypothetical protein
MLDGIKDALKSGAKLTWMSQEFLTEQKVQPWSDMPVWTGKEDALSRTKIDRALSKGLTFRPLNVTARDTLAWFKSLPQDRQSKLRAGINRGTGDVKFWKHGEKGVATALWAVG